MTDINHKDRGHSEIGASSSERWLNCPKSVELSRGIPDSGSSPYAEEGTAAHECSEYCFENNVEASETIGMTFNKHVVDEVMAEHVQFYLDEMKPYTEGEFDTMIEEKFELPTIHKDMYGSNDFCAMGIGDSAGLLVIADFKYGAGKDVSAFENTQLIIYALGAYHANNFIYDFERVSLQVIQPRVDNKVKVWEISVEELLEWEKKLQKGVKEVYSKNPKIESGSHCQWCKAKATCPLLTKEAEDMFETAVAENPVEDFKLPEIADMDLNKIINVLKHEKKIKDWMSAVAVKAQTLLESGVSIPGYKLVKKKSNRKLRDPQEIVNDFGERFGDDLYEPRKLIGTGKLEKLIGKKEVADYFYKPDSGTTIAEESDKRPAIANTEELFFNESGSNDFDDMEF